MPVPLEQVAKGLVAAGLATADELKSLLAELPAAERPTDGEALAKLLESRGKLTSFQAKHLLADKASALSVGEYLLVERIGAGGMGQVFKAKHRRMQRIVALKMMSPESMKDEASVRRFQREVRSAAKLEHLNIVTAYDAGQQGKYHYLVMQFVEGGDLANLVKAKGPLPVDKAVNFILQAARGLAFAHAEGIVHRDIKPANLLIDKKGCVKILDMGLARVVTGNDELTTGEQVLGTADYMSPEQASEAKEADARSDIYSLGCTLWYLLTGKRVFDGDTIVERLVKHRDAPRPSLVEARGDAPWSLEQTLHKMIARKADERFQKMDEVIRALDQVHASAGAGGMGSSVHADADLAQFLSGISQLQKGGASRIGGSSGSLRPGSSGAFGSGPLGSGALGSGPLGGLSGPQSGTRPPSAGVQTAAMSAAGGDTAAGMLQRKASTNSGRRKWLIFGGAAALVLAAGAGAWSYFGTTGESGASATGAVAAPRPPAPPLMKAPFTAAAAREAQQGWAAHLGMPVVSQNSLGMRMVLIPPGEYLMGSTPQEIAAVLEAAKPSITTTVAAQVRAEGPQHRVVITKPFLLGETEVTIGQYAKFVAATSWKTAWEFNRPSATDTWRRPGFDASDDTAVTRLDRGDCAAFCNWLSRQEKLPRAYDQSPTIGWIALAGHVGYRLPSDAQWEYACRAGTTTAFSFGDDPALLDTHAWVAGNSQNRVQPVGRKLPNAFGLFDMHGNVYEWMLDDYALDYYSRSPTNDPENTGVSRDGIYRSGQYGQNIAVFLRSAFRRNSENNTQLDRVGFRVARPINLAK
jgi:serine/threonine protein kinase/formylglycine-generating enzyme required for sulfatase activity